MPRDLPPLEKRGGFSPRDDNPEKIPVPPKPADAAASAKPAPVDTED